MFQKILKTIYFSSTEYEEHFCKKVFLKTSSYAPEITLTEKRKKKRLTKSGFSLFRDFKHPQPYKIDRSRYQTIAHIMADISSKKNFLGVPKKIFFS